MNRAAESVGRAIAVDRCDVVPVDARRYSVVQGTWCESEQVARLPRARSFVDLPEPLTTLLIEAAQRREPLQIDLVDDDPRIGAEGAKEINDALGMRSLAAVPVAIGDEVVGWMIVQSLVPRPWEPRQLAVCAALSHDLVSTLMQVRAFEQQRDSMQRLQELDRAKDSFISTVSHELRTPLTSIVGYLEVMRDGGLGKVPKGVHAGLSVIERNAVRLRDLVEDLLILSAYDAEAVQLEPQPLNLAGLARECRRSLTGVAPRSTSTCGSAPSAAFPSSSPTAATSNGCCTTSSATRSSSAGATAASRSGWVLTTRAWSSPSRMTASGSRRTSRSASSHASSAPRCP